MNNSRRLRIALLVNAFFSMTCAMLMMFNPTIIGEILGIQAPLVLQVVGIGLAVFALDLLHQATRGRVTTWRSIYSSMGDFLWVLATCLLLIFFPNSLSSSGNLLAITVALTVFSFGVWQLWSIQQAYKLSTSEYRLCVPFYVNAPAEEMWNVVSNLEDIKKYAASLKSSVVIEEQTPGVGTVRVCEDLRGKRWSEECVQFENGRSFVLRFVSEAPDFPFPVQTMIGGWEIVPCDRGTQIMVWWELMPKPKNLAPIILSLLAFQADRTLPKIIQNMAADALGSTSRSISEGNQRAIARLLPKFC